MTTLPIVGIIRLPEHATYYRDDGCNLAPSCLNCPLPVCKYDSPQVELRLRNDRFRKARKRGMSHASLAAKFGISVRTVSRIINNPKHGMPRALPDSGQAITLAQLEKKSVIHAHKPWPEMRGGE